MVAIIFVGLIRFNKLKSLRLTVICGAVGYCIIILLYVAVNKIITLN
jgi:hypothetical protein